MAKFTDSLWNIIKLWEGVVFEDDQDDEPTKFGVVADDIRDMIKRKIIPYMESQDDIVRYIKNLNDDTARIIMGNLYFKDLSLDKIIRQEIADKICLMSILMGKVWGIKCSQRAVRSEHHNFNYPIDDGIIGAITLSKINSCEPIAFLCAYRSECAAHLRNIAKNDSIKEKYLSGWLNRAYS